MEEKDLDRRKEMKNPHNYIIDPYFQPFCVACNLSTNKQYLKVPNLTCWNCGKKIKKYRKEGE